MNIAILLPSFFPNLTHLSILKNADEAYWLTDEIFSRKSLVHRGQIRNPDNAIWLTIPIHPDDKKKPLHEVRLLDGDMWIPDFMRTIALNYRNSVYFDFYEPEIKDDFYKAAETGFLTEAIIYFSTRLFRYLEWEHKPVLLNIREEALKLIEMHENAHVWVEPRSRFYRKKLPSQTEVNAVSVTYRQHFAGFISDCCVLDLLFQYGPESWKILDDLRIQKIDF